ncbi:hypothetical protein ONR75_11045 [Rhodopseudomonas sp. P2A-2r]|uniref:hypothetical protein n=1 Tax=Rhodopseudomonas sp. P2A-2r TaxID=2991972 RepID=UPI00223430AC|nr:hypothetical protein [Rhodopseudomonas sp. P2A-2r]UZE51096.1 hypothetical protein ONR75_11045 [Rhodopseudomonas sp. P2A-2r]
MIRVVVVAALLACVCGPTDAKESPKRFGSWSVTAESSRFGDGGSHVALVLNRNASVGLAVRCMQKKLSLAVAEFDPVRSLTVGEIYKIKFRVDDGSVLDFSGAAINSSMFEIEIAASVAQLIEDGKETTVRISSPAGVSHDATFDTRLAKAAFKALSRDCPID